ncbi:MAG: SRPBCC family protein [Polyangiaceae bacterium]|nr:SRPBCC family protein [Polyangiaceae bacterium]
MWFPTTPTELDFTTSSPNKMVFDAIIEATPDRVFDIFAKGEGQETWFQDFKAVRWHGPEPHSVGTTRDVVLKLLTVKERFVAWDRGERLTFSIDSITLPLVKRMMEDLQFEAVGEKGTRLVWTVHYELTLGMKPFHPVAKMIFGKMFRASLDGLVKYAAAHQHG